MVVSTLDNSHSCFLEVNLCLKRGAEICHQEESRRMISCEVPRHALGLVMSGFFKVGFDASQEFKMEVIASFLPRRDVLPLEDVKLGH